VRSGAATPLLGGDTASVGPLALADYDGDGTLDLFVGARIYPGGYPLSPSSHLYHNVAGVSSSTRRTIACSTSWGWCQRRRLQISTETAIPISSSPSSGVRFTSF